MMYLAHYAALRILLGILALSGPVRSERDFAFVVDLSAAIADATDDAREQDVLTRLAWLESGFRRNVADCSIRGDRGKSHGTFQIQPQSAAERRAACGSSLEQARLAIALVRRSAEACPGNVGADRLAMYVSGTCARGIREARHRWGDADAKAKNVTQSESER